MIGSQYLTVRLKRKTLLYGMTVERNALVTLPLPMATALLDTRRAQHRLSVRHWDYQRDTEREYFFRVQDDGTVDGRCLIR